MKKLLLSLGAVAAVAAPVAAVVACGNNDGQGSVLDQSKKTFLDNTPNLTAAQKAKINDAKTQDELTNAIAEVVAGQNPTGTGTPAAGTAATLTLAEANTQIAAIIAADSATVLSKSTPAEPTKGLTAKTTEGELARTIEVINSGFTVTFTYPSGATLDFYFLTDDQATIDAEVSKINTVNKATDPAQMVKPGTPVAITTEQIAYTDSTSENGRFLYAIDDLGSLAYSLSSSTQAAIEAVIAKIA